MSVVQELKIFHGKSIEKTKTKDIGDFDFTRIPRNIINAKTSSPVTRISETMIDTRADYSEGPTTPPLEGHDQAL